MLREKERDIRAKQLIGGREPTVVRWDPDGGLASVLFSDGSLGHGSCVRCPEPPCMDFTDAELHPHGFKDFPYDREKGVCPTSAIRWPIEASNPEVDPDRCIACGICVRRCPVKAIGLLDGGPAFVNDALGEHWTELTRRPDQQLVEEQYASFDNCKELGVLRFETADTFVRLRAALDGALANGTAQFPNLLVRNLLIALGTPAVMRRRGDTSIRIDVLAIAEDGSIAPIAVETGGAVMDAPRDVLDDVAVLASRYGVSTDQIVPVIITDALPNNRADYWQVLSDIQEVLDIRIKSLTIGTLITMIWARCLLQLGRDDAFVLNASNRSLIVSLENVLGRSLSSEAIGYPGCFESAK